MLQILKGNQILKRMFITAAAFVFMFSAVFAFAQPSHAATVYMKYSWDSAIYKVINGGSATYVTAQQYQAAGNPPYQTVGWIPGSKIYKFLTSTDELFLYPPNDDVYRYYHHLTLSEWYATGSRPVTGTVLIGFVKTSTNPTIYHVKGCNSGNTTYALSYGLWVYYGLPTPSVTASIPNCI